MIQSDISDLLATADEGGLPNDLEARLDSLRVDLETKLEGCCKAVRNYEAEEAALKQEAKRFSERAAAAANARERLKAYMKYTMEALKMQHTDAGLFKVNIQLNGGIQALEVTVPPEKLPEDCQKITISPDNAAIRKALAAGVEIDGVRLLPRGTSLRIK